MTACETCGGVGCIPEENRHTQPRFVQDRTVVDRRPVRRVGRYKEDDFVEKTSLRPVENVVDSL